jgi:hypothetical protein
MAIAPNGDIAGFLMTMPHYGPLVTQAAGSDRVPVRSLSFSRHTPMLRDRPPVQGIVKTIGIHPNHRGIGLMDALLVAMLDRAEGFYESWLGALIRADNLSRRFGAPVTAAERRYLLFAKEVAQW